MAWVVKRTDADGVSRFQVRFRDVDGVKRTAGTCASRREAVKAGRRSDGRVEDGTWINPASGRVTFRNYVEQSWWPSRHLEVSTKAAYRSYLDHHFIPCFGSMPMNAITASAVQAWVTKAAAAGLSPTSITKYHVMLHGVVKRAVRDRVIAHNPCAVVATGRLRRSQDRDGPARTRSDPDHAEVLAHTARRRRSGAGRICADPRPRLAHVTGTSGWRTRVW